MNENNVDKSETIADILREMRNARGGIAPYIKAVLRPDGSGYEMQGVDLKVLADRIEVAAERERETADLRAIHRCHDCETENATPRNAETTGNSAALREALETIKGAIEIQSTMDEDGGIHLDNVPACVVVEAIQKALTAPARNCDRHFPDRVAMYDEFKNWCNTRGHTMEPKLAFDAFDWLLAPAEGDTK